MPVGLVRIGDLLKVPNKSYKRINHKAKNRYGRKHKG